MKIKRINPFIVAYVVALVGLAVLGYTLSDYTIRKDLESRDAKVHNTRFVTDVGFVSLPRMNMSITSAADQTPGRLRIDMSLEVEQKDLARLEDFQPLITDKIVSYVRKLDLDQVRKPNAAPWLRTEILKQINAASYPVPVLDVVFRQLVVM